jgi:hypothetical protein
VTTPPDAPPPRRLPVGWLVLAGSVLASFIWWTLMPRPGPPSGEPAAPVAAAPEPAEEPKEEAATAPREGRDGFVTALSALEVFEVDYQDKRLRVKIRGGRTFNFTTRAPNADPLLVFHRDVGKAREKLAGNS